MYYLSARLVSIESMTQQNNPKWGYKRMTIYDHPLFPGKRQVLVHRLVMAEFLGRPLLPTEHIHHKDENRANNRRRNLKLMVRGKHKSIHMVGKKYSLGHKHSVETRRKMSLNHKGFEGKHFSVEARQKLSSARKNYFLRQKFPGL